MWKYFTHKFTALRGGNKYTLITNKGELRFIGQLKINVEWNTVIKFIITDNKSSNWFKLSNIESQNTCAITLPQPQLPRTKKASIIGVIVVIVTRAEWRGIPFTLCTDIWSFLGRSVMLAQCDPIYITTKLTLASLFLTEIDNKKKIPFGYIRRSPNPLTWVHSV